MYRIGAVCAFAGFDMCCVRPCIVAVVINLWRITWFALGETLRPICASATLLSCGDATPCRNLGNSHRVSILVCSLCEQLCPERCANYNCIAEMFRQTTNSLEEHLLAYVFSCTA